MAYSRPSSEQSLKSFHDNSVTIDPSYSDVKMTLDEYVALVNAFSLISRRLPNSHITVIRNNNEEL